MTDAFGNFIDAVESVIRRLQEPKDIVLAIEPYLCGDIGSQRRHTYDPDSAAMQEFISGYDPIAESK